jgi:hypothetical protein
MYPTTMECRHHRSRCDHRRDTLRRRATRNAAGAQRAPRSRDRSGEISQRYDFDALHVSSDHRVPQRLGASRSAGGDGLPFDRDRHARLWADPNSWRPFRDRGSPAMYCARRYILDTLLVEAARAAGAEIREATTVRDLLWQDDRVVGVRAVDEHVASTRRRRPSSLALTDFGRAWRAPRARRWSLIVRR